MQLSFLGAFLGGTLALLSPCSVMVLPAFFAYAFHTPQQVFSRTGTFFLGLSATLLPLGMLAGTLGAWVAQYRQQLSFFALLIVLIFGLLLLGGVRLPALTRQQSASSTGTAAIFSLGAVYGLAGGCTGPIFGAVLTIATFGGNPLLGGLTMLNYAAGMSLPLLILALLWDRIPRLRQLLRPRELVIGRWRNAWSNLIGGALIVAVALLMLLSKNATIFSAPLSASAQINLEGQILASTSSVSNLIFAVAAAAVLLLLWLYLRHRARARSATRMEI